MKARLLPMLFALLVLTSWGHAAAQADAVAAAQAIVAPVAEAAVQADSANQALLDAASQLVDPSAPQTADAPFGLAVPDATAQAQQCVPKDNSKYCGGRCSEKQGGCIAEVLVSVTGAAADMGPITGRRGKPGRPGVGDPPPGAANPPVCDVGGAANTRMKYTDTATPKHFQPENFRHSCLGDAAFNCDDPSNSAKPSDASKSCCSCYLYATYCAGAGTDYVQDKALTATTSHLLVMPAKPCSGVERWQTPECGWEGSKTKVEGVWNKAQSVIDAAVQSGIIKDRSLWGMAINPVAKRGQHQMHIHIAMVFPSLLAAITYGYHSKGLTDFYLDCGPNPTTKNTRLGHCTFSTQAANFEHPQVTIVQAKSAGEAQPFYNAYGVRMDNTNKNLLETSTLVLRVPFTTNQPYWAIVRNFNGAAECFFEPNGDKDLENACKTN